MGCVPSPNVNGYIKAVKGLNSTVLFFRVQYEDTLEILAEIISAWLSGKTVQYRFNEYSPWHDIYGDCNPTFWQTNREWRIKP